MNTVFKIGLKPVLCLALLTVVILYSCKTHYRKASPNYTLTTSPTSLERGKNIVFNVCGGCHYNRDMKKFVGHPIHDLPKFMGKVYSANLTNSKTYGATRLYTDAQLAYLIKTGIKYNGRFIPYMIRPTMADEDVNDIIVYLRSNEPPVSAADTSIGKTHLTLIGKMASKFQKPQPFLQGIKKPAADDAVANGRYLVDIIGCYHCHSKSILSLNYVHPEQSKHYMQGGMKFKDLKGHKLRAANLTPDNKTGIGTYSNSDFHRALKEGITPTGRKLNFPMPKFHDLEDRQIDDIYAYLRTLPAKEHRTR